MKHTKLLITLASLAIVGGLFGLSSANSAADAELLSGKRSYIVELSDDSEATRYAFKQKMNDLVGSGNYTITDSLSGSLMNGYAVTFNSSYRKAVKEFSVVKDVFFNQTYTLPDASTTSIGDVSTLDNGQPTDSDVSTTSYSRATMKIQDSSEGIVAPTNEGDGTIIGIMDTGLYANQVATKVNDRYEEKAFRPLEGTAATNAKLDETDVETARKATGTYGTDAKYVNNKIVWEYDYADSDNNVNTTTSNNHGTHVASLAAANGKTYEGAAPNAQLAILKVFSDHSSGATSVAMTKAFQDAINIGLDVVNLSLGSALYQVSDEENDREIYEMVNRACATGMVVNFAAGNDGRANFGSSTGFYADTLTLDTVEPAQLGAYALLNSPTIVASSFLDKSYSKKLVVSGKMTSFTEQNTDYPIADLFESTESYHYVYVGGVGEDSEYDAITTNGLFEEPTIAVVMRGDITFVEKATNAQKHGAKGVVIVNNADGDAGRFNLTTGATEPITIPVVSVPKTDGGLVFGNAGSSEGTVTYDATGILEDNDNAKHMSYFSSDGPNTNLTMNPNIAAPGSDILGAINGEYGTMSGTSMACPNYSGALATILSNNPGTTDEEKQEYKDHLLARIQSTATALHDDSMLQIASSHTEEGDGEWEEGSGDEKYLNGQEDYRSDSNEYNYASPRRAGSGMVNVDGAINNDVWLESIKDGTTASDRIGSGDAMLELGYVEGDNTAQINADFIVHNETSTAQTYDLKLYVAVPEARLGILGSEIETASIDTSALAKGLTTTYMQSTDDHMVAFDTIDTITVAAGDSIVSINKDYSSNDYLTKYCDKYYSESGTYLEGYVVLEPTGTTASGENTDTVLRMPFLKFYGDYSTAAATEKFDFERTDDSTLNSDIMASIAHNVSGGKPNADFGSQIYATDRTKYTNSAAEKAMNEIAVGSKTVEDYNFAKLGTDTEGEIYDENNHDGVVAGIKGESDLLVVKQFVNRSLYNAKVSLKDSSGKVLQTTWMRDYVYSDEENLTDIDDDDMLQNDNPGTNGYQLLKSFTTETLLSNGYYSLMATCTVPLAGTDGKNLTAGTYTLQFDYTLFATVSSSSSTRITQTKTINVTIPSDEEISKPAILSYGRFGNNLVIYVTDDTKYIRFPANDNNDDTSSVVSVTTYKSSSGNRRYVIVPTTAIENSYIRGIAVGKDGAQTPFVIDTKGNGDYALIGGKYLDSVEIFHFTTSLDETNRQIRYNYDAINSKGNTIKQLFSGTHGVVVKVKAGLAIKEVKATSYNSKGEATDTALSASEYYYDQETGQLVIYSLGRNIQDFVVTY